MSSPFTQGLTKSNLLTFVLIVHCIDDYNKSYCEFGYLFQLMVKFSARKILASYII